jgi:hypothetical protein
MNRALGCTLMLFVSVLDTAHAVPAKPLYEPPPAPKLPVPTIDLRDSTWMAPEGMDQQLNRLFYFSPDGSLQYGSTLGNRGQRASWKLEGNELYFEINNQYREFKGQVHGDIIVGQSWNKAGTRWETKLLRVRGDR